MHEEEGRERRGRAKKIDRFALAIAVHCKADAGIVQGNLNERDTFEKILSRVNKHTINEYFHP